MDDLISRQAAITEFSCCELTPDGGIDANYAIDFLKQLPSAQPDYQEVLGWLLAYHTKSFDLHGRYMPHEVIGWLVHDFANAYMAERREE